MSASRTPQVVSVGYDGRDVDDLVAHLQEEQVDVLVDVRLNPISRKPGLSKSRLAEALGEAGIGYVHLRELGNRDGFRSGQPEAVDYFPALLRPDGAQRTLSHVSQLLDHEVVALLCFEREHAQCHRGLVAEALAEQLPQLTVRTP